MGFCGGHPREAVPGPVRRATGGERTGLVPVGAVLMRLDGHSEYIRGGRAGSIRAHSAGRRAQTHGAVQRAMTQGRKLAFAAQASTAIRVHGLSTGGRTQLKFAVEIGSDQPWSASRRRRLFWPASA